MLQQPMINKMLAMRLHGMAEALKTQEQDSNTRELSFLERLGILIDQQWNWRENQALALQLTNAKLRGNPCVEDIDYRAARDLDKSVLRALTQESVWVSASSHRPWHRKPVATGIRILHASSSALSRVRALSRRRQLQTPACPN